MRLWSNGSVYDQPSRQLQAPHLFEEEITNMASEGFYWGELCLSKTDFILHVNA